MWQESAKESEKSHVFIDSNSTRLIGANLLLDFTALNMSNLYNTSDVVSNTSISKEVFEPETVSVPQAIGTAVALGIIMVGTITGNILVIVSVFTYKPLRNVQNIFLVSLAASDIAVAIFVMPFNLANSILGKWIFGLHLCKLWLTCDVLCCTASILNLCAIALDRYWAIHDPINYAQKRTLNRVLCMILGVWVISTLISVPPLIGWNDWPSVFTSDTPCQLTEERGYVIYSASGSFFIPLIIMTVVYIKIFQTARNRIRVKAKAAANYMKRAKLAGSANTSTLPLENLSPETSNPDAKTVVSILNCDSLSIDEEEKSSTPHETLKNGASGDPQGETNRKTEEAKPTQVVTVRSYMEQKERICLQKERRAAQVLGIVMGVFVLCWLPFFTMYVILPFCKACEISQKAANFITWLGYMNSALNPAIYTAFNTDFRKSFQRLLCGKVY